MPANDTNNASNGGDGIDGQSTAPDTSTSNSSNVGAGAAGQSDTSENIANNADGAGNGSGSAGAAGGGNASGNIADNANSSGNDGAVAAGEGAADDASGGNVPPPQRTQARDPFLFYSEPGNLERARNFQPADYSTEDALRGTTVRRTRISYEKDVTSLVMEALAQAEDQDRGIQKEDQFEHPDDDQGQGQG